MLKKIGDLFFKNLGLKILALIISVILWYVVLNINDPTVSKSFSCAVSVENADYLTNQGKTYEIVNGSTAYFNVKAPRSIMKNLASSDFKAVADMENLQNMSYVPIEVTATRYTSQVEIIRRTERLEIETEDLMSGQYIIMPDSRGVPAEGCIVGGLSVSPNVLKVSGPASVVQSISKVSAVIDVQDVATNISDRVIPTLMDEEYNVIDTTKLTLNLSSVIVRADILNTKEVALVVNAAGEPREGYKMVNLSYEPKSCFVMGDSASLNSLQTIVIPEDVLDVTDATSDIHTVVDISAYLPEGVSLVNAADKNVAVDIEIEAAVSRNFRIPTANITVNGASSNMEAIFPEEEIQVSITGLREDLDLLNPQDITGSIDVSGFAPGEHKANLVLDLDEEKYSLTDAVSVEFLLRRT